jgi:hypothetical protein
MHTHSLTHTHTHTHTHTQARTHTHSLTHTHTHTHTHRTPDQMVNVSPHVRKIVLLDVSTSLDCSEVGWAAGCKRSDTATWVPDRIYAVRLCVRNKVNTHVYVTSI